MDSYAAAIIVDDFIESGRNKALTSPVTAMEILVRPLKAGPKRAAHVHAFLTKTPHLSLLPIDIHVAQEAASLQATHRLKPVDALIAATGIVGQVLHLVTNDKQWKVRLAPIARRIKVLYLYDYVDRVT